MNYSGGDSLQAYFEQQNDKEAASIVAAVIALLPSNNTSWDEEEKIEQDDDDTINDNVLNNILLTKESEIAALKEVIIKWRSRALEAELNARIYYSEQLQLIKSQHEKEFKSMESRYTRKLYEQEDIISTLKDQVDHLIMQQQKNKYYRQSGDTDSFVSTINYDEDDEEEDDQEDTRSIISSIYDRDVEQGLATVEKRPELTQLKSENILDSIQVTMRAIEHELSFHTSNTNTTDDDNHSMMSIMSTSSIKSSHNTTTRRRQPRRRSPTFNSSNTYYSSATLIDSEPITNNKKIRKSSFFINRIFKKAFPKLYKKNNTTTSTMNLKYTKKSLQDQQEQCSSIDSFPRSSTDETLGVYSTTTSAGYQKPVHILDLLPSMNSNNPIQV